MFGADRYVVAIWTLLVGYKGFVLVAVTVFGGIGCMGAYLVGPVCIVYVTSYSSAALPALATASLVVSSVAGPVVPSMSLVSTLAPQTPDMPE